MKQPAGAATLERTSLPKGPVRTSHGPGVNPLPQHAAVLQLQHAAGNSAISRMLAPQGPPTIRRTCAECAGGARCSRCEEEEGLLRRSSDGTASGSVASTRDLVEIVRPVIETGGSPLDLGTRLFMESRFGYDFSAVRIHTDPRAAASAPALGALAYTLGRHVVFAPGRYAPASREGQRMLAHELSHVIQHERVGPAWWSGLALGRVDDPAEGEADRAAAGALAESTVGGAAQMVGHAGAVAPAIHRQASPEAQKAALTVALMRDADKITDILHEMRVDAEDEQKIIDILTAAAEKGLVGKQTYLERLFVRLTSQTRPTGISGQQLSYYRLLFERVDRVDEIRVLRDRHAPLFRGDDGIKGVSITEQDWAATAEEFWAATFKSMGQQLQKMGAPKIVQNLLGALTGVIEGFARTAIQFAMGIWSLAEAAYYLQGAVLYFLTGAADEAGLGLLKSVPLIGSVFDPETYRERYEKTLDFLRSAGQALRDPSKLFAMMKDAAVKEWARVLKDYREADDFNKSRIIADGVVQVGMAVGMAIKDLPQLAKMTVTIAKTVTKVVVLAVRTVVEALKGVFMKGLRVLRGAWRVVEEVLEGGGKRLRYFFTEAATDVAEEVPAAEAQSFIKCSDCKVTAFAEELAKKPETGSQYEKRVLREDLEARKKSPPLPTTYVGTKKKLTALVKAIRKHATKLMKKGMADPFPKLNEAPLTQGALEFINSRPALKVDWDRWLKDFAEELQKLERQLSKTVGDPTLKSDLERRKAYLQGALEELQKFGDGPVGNKELDIVDVFSKDQRIVVTDITLQPYDEVHNFKTRFYVEVLKEITGWDDVTGIDWKSVSEVVFLP